MKRDPTSLMTRLLLTCGFLSAVLMLAGLAGLAAGSDGEWCEDVGHRGFVRARDAHPRFTPPCCFSPSCRDPTPTVHPALALSANSTTSLRPCAPFALSHRGINSVLPAIWAMAAKEVR